LEEYQITWNHPNEMTENQKELSMPYKNKPIKKKRKRPVYIQKPCRFCDEKLPRIDYKDIENLRQFVTERGKMLSRRITGTCARHQRQLSREIKRARYIAFLPYVSE